MITLQHYLLLSALLFAIGTAGLVLRRNALIIFMALEINLNAANLAAVAFARFNHFIEGEILALFIIAVAAAEVAVGLAILVILFRNKQSISVDNVTSLKS